MAGEPSSGLVRLDVDAAPWRWAWVRISNTAMSTVAARTQTVPRAERRVKGSLKMSTPVTMLVMG